MDGVGGLPLGRLRGRVGKIHFSQAAFRTQGPHL